MDSSIQYLNEMQIKMKKILDILINKRLDMQKLYQNMLSLQNDAILHQFIKNEEREEMLSCREKCNGDIKQLDAIIDLVIEVIEEMDRMKKNWDKQIIFLAEKEQVQNKQKLIRQIERYNMATK